MTHRSPLAVPANHGRRSVLQMVLAGSALWLAGGSRVVRAAAAPEEFAPVAPAARTLRLLNTHTGESLQTCYFKNGQYVATSLQGLDHLLRDHRSGESHQIDPQLFDVLHTLALGAECEPQFEIISGYRSPATNAALRSKSKGVASGSLHLQGKAIDVRLQGAPCDKLRNLAMSMQCGGVGYYARSNFVHLDTGRVRFWAG